MKSESLVTIQYCTQCQWLLRAAWMAQELLTTFSEILGGVTLIPGKGGIFEIAIEEKVLWSRENDGGFPDIKVLKQKIRDEIAPDMNLGHSEKK